MSGAIAPPPVPQAVFDWLTELRVLPQVMITFRCEVGKWVEPPTLAGLEGLVTRALADYHAISRDYIPKLGVASYAKRQTGWPHIHICLQGHNRSPMAPVLDRDALADCARCCRLSASVSCHDRYSGVDLRDYVARHMLRHGSQVVVGAGVRVKFDDYHSADSGRQDAGWPRGS